MKQPNRTKYAVIWRRHRRWYVCILVPRELRRQFADLPAVRRQGLRLDSRGRCVRSLGLLDKHEAERIADDWHAVIFRLAVKANRP